MSDIVKNHRTPFVYDDPDYDSSKFEYKYFDCTQYQSVIQDVTTDWNNTDVTPGDILCLFCPLEGTQIYDRVGRMVDVTAISLRGNVYIERRDDEEESINAHMVRIILLINKMSNGNIFYDAKEVIKSGFGGVTTNGIDMYRNTAFLSKYRILGDQTYIIQNPSLTWDDEEDHIDSSGIGQRFEFNYKFNPPVRVHFNNNPNDDVRMIVDNSFHIIAGEQSLLDFTPRCQLSFQSRVEFLDV